MGPNTLDEIAALVKSMEEDDDDGDVGPNTQANIIVGLVPPVVDPLVAARAANGRVAKVMGDLTADLYDLLPDHSVAGPDQLEGVGTQLVPTATWQAIRFALGDKAPDTSSSNDLVAGLANLVKAIKDEHAGKKIDANDFAFELLQRLNLEPHEGHKNSAAKILPHILLKWGITLPQVFEIVATD